LIARPRREQHARDDDQRHRQVVAKSRGMMHDALYDAVSHRHRRAAFAQFVETAKKAREDGRENGPEDEERDDEGGVKHSASVEREFCHSVTL